MCNYVDGEFLVELGEWSWSGAAIELRSHCSGKTGGQYLGALGLWRILLVTLEGEIDERAEEGKRERGKEGKWGGEGGVVQCR